MAMGQIDVPENVRVYSVGKEKGYSEPRRAMEFYRLLFRVLKNDRVDVVFSHMIPIFTVLAFPVLRSRGIPIVTWYAHRQVTTLLKLAHRVSDRMVSINASSYPYHHDKFIALGHGIDTDLFSPARAETKGLPILLSVGRLSPIKDPLTLVRAVQLLREKGVGVCSTIIGAAPERDRSYAGSVRERVKALGLESIVDFAGPLPNQELVQWYRRCFAHVNCSPADGALDKAVLEAMACAKPSLSSTLGFRDTMGEWTDRLIFRHGDTEDLAQKVGWLFQRSVVEQRRIGTELRQSVIERHSLERLADRLSDLFVEVR
jgi:glycosyltransferase involved in cell wall biosynthesis